MSIILVGDIGGTNIRYKLFSSTLSEDTLLKAEIYQFSEFDGNLISSLQLFLENQPTPEIGVIGICGIIKDNELSASCQYGSGFSGVEISEKFGIPKVILLNDLENSGYGILSLSPDEYVNINSGQANPRGIKVCVAIGTGLGQCFILPIQDSYRVFPSEGGFQDYCPKSKKEKLFYDFMCEKNKVPGLTYNLFLTGACANLIYEYAREVHKDLINPEFDAQFFENSDQRTKLVMEAGFNKTDQVAVAAVQIWQKLIGNLLGNIFTNFLPTGGIYLFGGVVCKNFAGILKEKHIKEGFYCGRSKLLHQTMKEVPIFIVKIDELGLRGGLYYARKELFGIR